MIHIITHDLSSYKRETDEIFSEFDDRYEATFFTDERLGGFESSLYQSLNLHRSLGLIYAALSAVGAALALIAIGALNIYESFFEQIIIKREFSLNYENIVALIATLFVIVVITMLPSVGGGESNVVNKMLKTWFNGELRRTNRLKRAFARLKSKPLHIYGPDSLSAYEMEILFGAIAGLNLGKNEIFLHVRNEGLRAVKSLLGFSGEAVRSNTELDATKIVRLFDPAELAMFELASFVSVKSGSSRLVPLDLLEILASNLLSANNQIGVFVHRGFDEYALLKNRFQGRSELALIAPPNERLCGKAEFFIRANLENIVSKLHEPLGVYWLFEKSFEYEMLHKRQIWLLKELIRLIMHSNSYQVLSLPLLKEGLKFNELNSDFGSSMLQGLDVASLEALFGALKRAGRFGDAHAVAEYLSPLDPQKYAISKAVVFERDGSFAESLEIFENIDAEALDDETRAVYYERFAWLIVSARFENLRQKGLECADKLEQILRQKALATPSRVWNLNNIRANYCEWLRDYAGALKFHEQALKVPAAGENEYAGSLLNYSIILRFLFLQTREPHYLQNALKYALGSVEYKRNLGDMDESPIVLHNLALHLFYGITLGVFERERADEMLGYSARALAILDATGSNKKLGIILVENIAASEILGLDTSELRVRLGEISYTGDELAIADIRDKFRAFTGRELY